MKKYLLLILILAFLVRLINLNQSLWLDEAISVTTVQQFNSSQILTKFIITDVHPPLYYLVLDFWGFVFGTSEVAMRLPSVIFAVLTCFFVYKIGSKIFNEKTGLVAALFFALNPLSIYYSQEARMYSMIACLITIAVYSLISRKRLAFILSFAAALYTDYLPILMFPIFILANLSGSVIALLLFVPWLPIFMRQFSVGTNMASVVPEWGNVVGAGTLKNLVLTYIKFIFGRVTLGNKVLYGGLSFLVGLEYFLIVVKAKNKLLWGWLIVPILIGFLISLKIPIFSYHRFLFVLPAFCLLLASGSLNTKSPSSLFRVSFIVIISLASMIFFNLNSSLQRENWREATLYMQTEPGSIAIPSRAQAAPIYYYSPSLIVEDTKNFKPSSKNIYLIRYVQEFFDPNDTLRKTLESRGYTKTEEKGFNNVLVWKYQQL